MSEQPFDAFEVAQVAAFSDPHGPTTYWERTEALDEGWEEEAIEVAYTVFGHLPTGGVDEVRDFTSHDEALAFAHRLAAGRPVEDFTASGLCVECGGDRDAYQHRSSPWGAGPAHRFVAP